MVATVTGLPGPAQEKPTLKKIHTVVAVAGIVAAGAAAWWWQKQPAPQSRASSPAADGSPRPGVGGRQGQGGAALVEVARAESATLTDEVTAVGSLKSSHGVMLRPEVSGRIAHLGFSDGARVRRGQLLVQLDDTLQQAQLKQSQAQASIARTNLQRSRELLGQGFISQSAVDQNAAALEVADAQVALSRAQVARMKVVAPFDGTAGLKLVNAGDYVKDGADIVNIEDLTSLTVRFALPERTIDRLRTGQPVELTLDALPGRTFSGRVLAVDSQVDANGRALQVLAQVANPGALLKPGMFARPRVVFSVRQGAVVVPEEALVPMAGRQMIFKVAPGADGKPVSQRLEAQVGVRLPGKVEILSGIKAGDTVVTAGHSRLLRGDGVPLRVVDLAASAPAAGGRGGAAAAAAAADTAAPAAAASGARRAGPPA